MTDLKTNGLVIWVTGLAGSGKTTICRALRESLVKTHSNVVYLDGDEIRLIFGEMQYDKESRIILGKKYSNLARVLSSQGMIVIAGVIGMFGEIYAYNRANIANYLEVYVKCDFSELQRRDQKGLYSGALSGLIPNVVGVDIPYDPPSPHITIDNSVADRLGEKVRIILEKIGVG